MLEYNPNLKEPARDLRKNMTEAEQALWSRLRRKQLLDVQFYRQKTIESYIVDFYAPAAGLVVEIDGSQHQEPAHMRRDRERDQNLAEAGLLVMRFDNLRVLNKLDAVIGEIYGVMQMRLEIPPNPPLPKGVDVKAQAMKGEY